MIAIFLSFIFIFLLTDGYSQKFENLAPTPPMGWNSWNKFGCNVSEDLIKGMADAMVTSGMKDAGYEYIIIDDCWQVDRDNEGNIIADPERFPSGMKKLAEYIHSKGLKFGIYSDGGTKTCQGRPGSRGYEFQDARTYASWGVDYLKYDWCYTGSQDPESTYLIMRDALYKAGRPIVFSISEFKTDRLWSIDIGHLRRTTPDIEKCFSCEYNWGSMGVLQILDMQMQFRIYTGPDHWNDLDMLEVGNEGLSIAECRAHFSLWCMLASPLIAGNDLRDMSSEIIEILTKKEVIAIDQDPLGVAALKWIDFGDWEIWVKPLAEGDYAYCFLNRSNKILPIDFDLKGTIYDHLYNEDFTKRVWKTYKIDGSYKMTDLWKNEYIGTTKENLKAKIPGHDVLLIRLSKK